METIAVNKKSSKTKAIFFSIIAISAANSTLKPMKRDLNPPVRMADSKHQKLAENPTPDESTDEPTTSFSDLPKDVKEKIIAASSNKDNIRKTNRELRDLASRTNPYILLHDPLHLKKVLRYPHFIKAVDEGNIKLLTTLVNKYSVRTELELSKLRALAIQNKHFYMLPILTAVSIKFTDTEYYNPTTVMNSISRAAVAAITGNLDEIKIITDYINEGTALVMSTEQAIIEHPAFIAADLGHLDILEYFSKERPDLLQEISRNGDSLLFVAAQNNNPSVMEFLINTLPVEYINAQDPDGRTPLSCATSFEMLSNVKSLLDNGATIQNAQEFDFYEARHLHPAFIAIYTGNVEMIKLLSQYKGVLTQITNDGRSLLHAAAGEEDNPEIIQFLLNNTTLNINAKTNHGNTPLHLAVINQNLKNVKLLLEKGADPHIENNVGQSAMRIAFDHNLSDIIELLRPYYERDSVLFQ